MQRRGLRGSATDLNLEEAVEGIEKYKLDEDAQDDAVKGPSLKGLACYASPLDDPYITQHVDSDEEEEREDFLIKETDNLLAVAKIQKVLLVIVSGCSPQRLGRVLLGRLRVQRGNRRLVPSPRLHPESTTAMPSALLLRPRHREQEG